MNVAQCHKSHDEVSNVELDCADHTRSRTGLISFLAFEANNIRTSGTPTHKSINHRTFLTSLMLALSAFFFYEAMTANIILILSLCITNIFFYTIEICI